MFPDLSHRICIIVFLLSLYFAFVTKTYWVNWTVVSVVAATCLIVDFTFFQEGQFLYDPDYEHWKTLCEIHEVEDFVVRTDS